MNCGPLFWAASLHDTQCLPDPYQSEHEGSDSQTHPLTRTKPKRGTRVRLWGSETGNVFRQLSEWFWSGWWAQNPAAGFFSVFPLKCPRDSSGAAVLTVFILKQYSYLSKIYSKHEQNRRSFRRLTGCVSVVSGPVLSPHRLVNWIRTHLWHSGAEKVPQPRLHRWTLLSDCLWRRFIY